jgi:hypothetical protein
MLHVPRQRQLERPRRSIPDIDGPISRTDDEPTISRVKRYAANPSKVARNCTVHLPVCMPLGFGHRLANLLATVTLATYFYFVPSACVTAVLEFEYLQPWYMLRRPLEAASPWLEQASRHRPYNELLCASEN